MPGYHKLQVHNQHGGNHVKLLIRKEETGPYKGNNVGIQTKSPGSIMRSSDMRLTSLVSFSYKSTMKTENSIENRSLLGLPL